MTLKKPTSLRKRPSGVGSNSRRFATVKQPNGEALKVPVAKDVGTFLFLSRDGETWPERPVGKIMDAAPDLQDGTIFDVENLVPAAELEGIRLGMGDRVGAQVVRVKVIVSLDPTGRFSQFAQLKRLIYAVLIPESIDELGGTAP